MDEKSHLLFIDRYSYLRDVKVLLEKRWEPDQGYRILLAGNLTEGLGLLQSNVDRIELIALHTIAETSMVQEAITVLRQLSVAYITLITPFDNEDAVAEMYDFGADLCVPSNCGPKVAVAYFAACYRRGLFMPRIHCIAGMEDIKAKNKMMFGHLSIDPVSRTVTRGGVNLHLTAKEFDLMYYLARNANILLSPEKIFENVWDSEDRFNSNLSSRISRLRKKIEHDPRNPIHIITKYGQGYYFQSN